MWLTVIIGIILLLIVTLFFKELLISSFDETIAYLLTNRLSTMIVLSAFFGALSSVVGIYFSYVYNLPPGPVIALAATAIFLLALIFSPKQGLLWQKVKKQATNR